MRPGNALALASLLLAACAALQPPHPESPALYLLDAQPAAAVQRPPHDLVLAIAPPRARPGFATAQMAYVREPHKLDYYAKSRWVDTPARMLAPLMVQAIAQNGTYRAVVQAPSPVAADLRLDTELVRLQQDFATQPSRVQLTLRVQLVEVKTNRALAAQEFDVQENAPSENAYGGAIAANRALARLLAELGDFCSARLDAR